MKSKYEDLPRKFNILNELLGAQRQYHFIFLVRIPITSLSLWMHKPLQFGHTHSVWDCPLAFNLHPKQSQTRNICPKSRVFRFRHIVGIKQRHYQKWLCKIKYLNICRVRSGWLKLGFRGQLKGMGLKSPLDTHNRTRHICLCKQVQGRLFQNCEADQRRKKLEKATCNYLIHLFSLNCSIHQTLISSDMHLFCCFYF